jgi:phospholipid-binding lipoprotein MlaA
VILAALLLATAPLPQQQGAAPELADPLADPAAAPSTAQPVVVAAVPVDRSDPLERTNRRFFDAQQKFDRRFFRPAAMGYKKAVPSPVRSGLRNFFRNLGEPIVALNYLLQLKPGKAAETVGRFVINTGLGVGGLVDVARAPGVRLPHRANGFGNTLALYGVKPGPYLFLPFVGPTTVRDLLGGQADGLVLPLAVGKPFNQLEYQIPKGAITGLDRRAEADAELNALFSGAVDPYATLRSVYLQNRAGETEALRGRKRAKQAADDALTDPAAPNTTAPELGDPLTDPAATPSPKP